MTTDKAVESVEPWFHMTPMDILAKFSNLSKNTINIFGEPELLSSAFIPGTRKDRVLLVAHVDTVWGEKKLKVGFDGRCLVSRDEPPVTEDGKFYKRRRRGIGADDRAGVAILWELRQLGHSMLLVHGEERGCMGSKFFMHHRDLAQMLQKHQFAIEFDRHGNNDLVYYHVGSRDFKKYCPEQTGFENAHGTYTDICELCKEMCGLNISVGYYDEHSEQERLNIKEWTRTLKATERWLSQSNIPRFVQSTGKVVDVNQFREPSTMMY